MAKKQTAAQKTSKSKTPNLSQIIHDEYLDNDNEYFEFSAVDSFLG